MSDKMWKENGFHVFILCLNLYNEQKFIFSYGYKCKSYFHSHDFSCTWIVTLITSSGMTFTAGNNETWSYFVRPWNYLCKTFGIEFLLCHYMTKNLSFDNQKGRQPLISCFSFRRPADYTQEFFSLTFSFWWERTKERRQRSASDSAEVWGWGLKLSSAKIPRNLQCSFYRWTLLAPSQNPPFAYKNILLTTK